MMLIPKLVIPLVLISGCLSKTNNTYCMPTDKCWPAPYQWESFASELVNGKLHNLSDLATYNKICKAAGKNAYKLEEDGQGRCMQYHDCSKKGCDAKSSWNIPMYSVEVQSEEDIMQAIKFANTHNIYVTIKTSGHNYAGASMGYGSLLIWMKNFKKFGTITKDMNVCSKTYNALLKIGGGQVWLEAYKAVGDQYHLIGGGGLTVSAAGGWLMGGGLSASSRLYGMGVDNVVQFEIITAEGEKMMANDCTNADLFWALRGGGGGTFGVVTAVWYKLHQKKPFCEFQLSVNDFTLENNYNPTTVYKWIDYLVDNAPTMSNKWGGYWGFTFAIFYYEGTEIEMKNDGFYKGAAGIDNADTKVRCSDSYYKLRGLPENINTDETGADEFNIASRLIPEDFVKENPAKMKEIFKWMVFNGFYTFNYIVGGAMQNVTADATAVHPAMRKALFQMETFAEPLIQKLRDEFPDSGAGFNHAAKNETDWKNQFWGSNLSRLKSLKTKFDPDNRFNCWHGVGYQEVPEDKREVTDSAESIQLGKVFFVVVTYYLLTQL